MIPALAFLLIILLKLVMGTIMIGIICILLLKLFITGIIYYILLVKLFIIGSIFVPGEIVY